MTHNRLKVFPKPALIYTARHLMWCSHCVNEHRKKNLTLAKTLSVHKLNCALQRKSQLIGSFASDKKSPKLCHRESSSRVLILPQALTFRILTGKQHKSHIQKFGTITKKLTQKQQKQNQFIWWAMMEIRNIDIDGRKIITLQISTKATMQNTASDQKNHFLSW